MSTGMNDQKPYLSPSTDSATPDAKCQAHLRARRAMKLGCFTAIAGVLLVLSDMLFLPRRRGGDGEAYLLLFLGSISLVVALISGVIAVMRMISAWLNRHKSKD